LFQPAYAISAPDRNRSVTFFFYYADSAVISPMMPFNTKIVEEVEAKKESSARIAETEIDVQVLQWTLIF
jgi:hypothetical protein